MKRLEFKVGARGSGATASTFAALLALLSASITGVVVAGVVTGNPSVAATATSNGHALFAWGDNTYRQSSVPVRAIGGQDTIRQVAAGGEHGLAVVFYSGGTFSNSRAVPWGDNRYGQTTLPVAILQPPNVRQVAAGQRHSLALTTAGRVVAWGDNSQGQTTVPTALTDGTTTVTQVAAGGLHSLALTSAGRVVAWGDNSQGQTAVPTALTDGTTTVTQVAAGGLHSLALTSAGRVVAWGDNSQGQTAVPTALTDGTTTVTQVAAGGLHSLALTSAGRVVAWGDNSQGQATIPAALTDGDTIVDGIAAGRAHNVVSFRWTANRPQLAFTSSQFTGSEGTDASITIRRSGDLDFPVGVNYHTDQLGTATAGVDYTETSGYLEFAAGETEKSFPVEILADSTADAGETIGLTLLFGEKGGATLGTPVSAKLAITESKSTGPVVVAFTEATRTLSEDVGTASLTVARSGNTQTTATVDYARNSGTATPGTDFVLNAGSLTFAPGETTKTIPITITNDTTAEPTEAIIASLNSPGTGTTLGSPSSTTVTIDASDQQPDGWISTAASTGYIGDNIYNTDGAGQTKASSAKRNRTAYFYVRIYNDGNTTNSFTVRGSTATSGSSVTYYSNGTNVTSAMTSAAGNSVRLAAGAYVQMQVRIKILTSAAIGSTQSASVSATWTGDGDRSDTAKANVRVIR